MKKHLLFAFLFVSIFFFSQNREANDCTNYIQVCGNQSIQLNPNGIGIQEISTNVCDSWEHNSLWLRFTVETDGVLGFDLIPSSSDINIDYDFWVFGPNVVCGNIGTSIRCSTTNPLASGATTNQTGMRDSEPETDFFEGPGKLGDNYIKSLNVKAGESYFLVIDRPIGNSEFTLNWTGTAKLTNPFKEISFNTIPPINICGNVSLDFTTFTSTILNGNSGFKVGYFRTLDDASYNENEILTPINLSSGYYFYRIYTDSSECFISGKITVKQSPLPNLDTSKYISNLCDNNLDGKIDIDFNAVIPQIVQNFSYFKTEFFSDSGMSPATKLPQNWNYTTDTKVYVKVNGDKSCPIITGEIDFKIKNRIKLKSLSETVEICDNEIDGSQNVKLSDFKTLFNNDATASVTFYKTRTDAYNETNPTNPDQIISKNQSFYYRFSNATDCPEVSEINFIFKQPKKSAILLDKTICKTAITDLDAGAGFDKYLWSNGATTQSIKNVAVGDYFVDLSSNGCVYRQYVKVIAAENPVITSIDVTGTTATANVKGGTVPYQYSLDKINWYTSNIFNNIKRGINTMYVKDKYNCEPIAKDFLVVNLLNVITPNGDGYNDYFDYSDLRSKKNVSIQIFDRFGQNIFKTSDNNFIWNGTINGRPVPTANYWYIIRWTEPDTNESKIYSGWVLVKSR